MLHETFLFHPKPIETESLTSYIHRVATENLASPHELWRLLLPLNAHYPQSAMSPQLDIFPDTIFNLAKFESMLHLEEGLLDLLTFIPVFKKLGIEDNRISNSRVLSGLVDRYRKYCPKCLLENKIYKLIWQVKEIILCDKHSIKLYTCCWNCNREISLLPNSNKIEICPHCEANLSSAPQFNDVIDINYKRILDDWNYLLQPELTIINQTTQFSNQQNLALKILYLASNSNSKSYNLKPILQIARETKTMQTFIHLSLILNIIREVNLSFKDFILLEVPNEFVNQIFYTKIPLINQHSCIAPWCQNYNKPGSLKRTATATKVKNNGNKYNYYMYCSKCGVEYCLENKSKSLQERGYFVNFAWSKVRTTLNQQLGLNELAKVLNSPVDKVKRSIIFLYANKLVSKNILPLSIPNEHNKTTINKFISLINTGLPLKKIQKTMNLSYNEFLYYWFLPEIKIAFHNYKKPHPKKLINENKRKLIDALDYFLRNNISLTIKNISKHIGVCPETLRYWGALPLIKESKETQKNKNKEIKREELILKAKKTIEQILESNEELLSDEVYKRIGIRRTVMVRTFPDVTEYISKIIKSTKLDPYTNVYRYVKIK